MRLTGRVIKEGHVEGEALVSQEPISFFGGVNPETGAVIEPGHELQGKTIGGKILVFPTGKGSTVGSYTLYRLRKNGAAPAGIINAQSDAVVAVGAIISEIPMVDHIDISRLATGMRVTINRQLVEADEDHELKGG